MSEKKEIPMVKCSKCGTPFKPKLYQMAARDFRCAACKRAYQRAYFNKRLKELQEIYSDDAQD